MPQDKRFTSSELDYLKANYDSLPVEKLAATLGRTPKSVRAKLERLGLKLSVLERNKPHAWTESEIEYLKSNYNTISDLKMSKQLGLSESMVCRKRLELDLRVHKYEVYISNEYAHQFINGKRTVLHRAAMEKHIGRKLTKHERVHHIDGDKTNYQIENLYLCDGRSDHMFVHASLERVAFELVKDGTIKFDPKSGKYYL